VFLLSTQNEVKLLEGGATWPPEIGLYKQIQRPNPEFWPNLYLSISIPTNKGRKVSSHIFRPFRNCPYFSR
jgi:hypothetical protein